MMDVLERSRAAHHGSGAMEHRSWTLAPLETRDAADDAETALVTFAAVFVVLVRHQLDIAPAFHGELIRHAARFGLSQADVDALVIAHGCPRGNQ